MVCKPEWSEDRKRALFISHDRGFHNRRNQVQASAPPPPGVPATKFNVKTNSQYLGPGIGIGGGIGI